MTDPNNKMDGWLNRAKTVVEIMAIFVAGYWAYDVFVKKEAPLLGSRITVSEEPVWHSEGGSSWIEYSVAVKNIGVQPVTLTGGNVALCPFMSDIRVEADQARGVVPVMGKAHAVIVTGRASTKPSQCDPADENNVAREKPTLSGAQLVGRYDSGTSDQFGFTFMVGEKISCSELAIVMDIYECPDPNDCKKPIKLWSGWNWLDRPKWCRKAKSGGR